MEVGMYPVGVVLQYTKKETQNNTYTFVICKDTSKWDGKPIGPDGFFGQNISKFMS